MSYLDGMDLPPSDDEDEYEEGEEGAPPKPAVVSKSLNEAKSAEELMKVRTQLLMACQRRISPLRSVLGL